MISLIRCIIKDIHGLFYSPRMPYNERKKVLEQTVR